ncbi:aspartic proteinase [Colletotrichum karsti]|uniref:Aspartic proteinase n=1 Tax=Colletotrichum karsti TaxID=1095194 RepID=A0A9P6I7M3_9PEZI|nr:aspartic proteinase [Colletotrichum karsti]KAF9878397.1 aspartic proteinase [Colletotrichum karsti]
MRTSALCAVAVCAAAASAQVRLPFTRQPYPKVDGGSVSSRAVDERRSTVDVFTADTVYLVNVTVGTPPQGLSLMLSVQAGETWVPNDSHCSSDGYSVRYGWCKYGSFKANESSSYVNPGTEDFMTSYTEGYAYGEVMSETLGIGDSKLEKVNMGFVNSADIYIGVLGLGFNTSAYIASYSSNSSLSTGLPTVPDRLLTDGQIKSTAYSLWLDDDTAESGNLLLGAIDKSKFEEGSLIRFPIDTSFSSQKIFDTTIYSANGSKSSSDPLEPLGDLGSFYMNKPNVRLIPHNVVSWFPDDLARDIYKVAGAVWYESRKSYVVPCSTNTSTAQLTIQLHGVDGPILQVPISNLILPPSVWSSGKWSWDTESATTYCLFGIQSYNSTTSGSSSSSSDVYSLGGLMLKRAYVVFDLANEEIAIGKTKFGGTAAEDIIVFPSYGAEIPESTSVSVRSSRCSEYSTSSDCSSDSGGDYYGGYYGSSGLSRGAKIGIGVGVGAFVLTVLGLTVWAVMRCRRIRRAEAEVAEKQGSMEDGKATEKHGDTNFGKDGSLPLKSPVSVSCDSAAAEPVTTSGEPTQEGRDMGTRSSARSPGGLYRFQILFSRKFWGIKATV